MTHRQETRTRQFGQYSAEDMAGFQGFVLKDGRRGGFCWDEKPRCIGRAGEAHGHRFKPRDPEALRTLTTEMVARCQHKAGAQQPICGALLYIAVLSFGGSAVIRGQGQRCMLIVELHEKMLDQIGQPMLFLERMALIEIALPGVLLDIGVRGDVEDPDALKRQYAADADRRAQGG